MEENRMQSHTKASQDIGGEEPIDMLTIPSMNLSVGEYVVL